MTGNSKIEELFLKITTFSLFKRIFAWKQIKSLVEDAKTELNNLKEILRISRLESENARDLKQALDEATSKNQDLQHQIIVLDKMRIENVELQQQIKALNEIKLEKQALQQQNIDLQKNVQDMMEAKSQIALEKTQISLEKSQLLSENTRLQNEYTNLKTSYTDAINENDRYHEALTRETEQKRIMEQQHQELKNTYDSLSNDIINLRENYAADLEQRRAAIEKASALEEAYQKISVELQEARDIATAETEGRKFEQKKYEDLKAEFNEQTQELTAAKESIAAEESVKAERSYEFERRVENLNTLIEQMKADSQQEKERREAEAIEREEILSRTWQSHETSVAETMKSIAKKYDIIRCEKNEYPNPGTPDNVFLIGGMYTIFDAKSPKNPEDLNNFPQYLKTQAEGMKKYCKYENVRKDAFLVVPISTIERLETFVYNLAEYNVYIITPESIFPIIQMLKTLENYDFAEQLSPEDRDKLCRFIGRLSHTTKRKVQIDTYFSREFVSVLRDIDTLPDEFANEIGVYEQKAKLNPPIEKRAKMISVADVSADVSKIENEILGWSVIRE